MQPQFPIYIPSKSRAEIATTPRFLDSIGVPYRLVVEEQQFEEYNKFFPTEKLLILDPIYKKTFDPLMELQEGQSTGSGPARNFLWEHSIAEGHDFHWTMDDNITLFARLHKNQRIPVGDATIFAAMEEFVLRYENIAMAGPQYWMFAPSRAVLPPFAVGTRIYSCNLIRNDLPYRWRGRYNEDTILSLDILKSNHWQTVLFNAFLQYKLTTQKMVGGNTEAFYAEEGTLPKSQMLVNAHPDVSKVSWKFGRWHHHVNYEKFKDIPLIKKADYATPDPNKYKSKLVPTINVIAEPVVDLQTSNTVEHPLVEFYEKQIENIPNLTKPEFPIYIPTKKRAEIARTPRLLDQLNIPYILAVEKDDLELYSQNFPNAEFLLLPESNQGIAYARNQCKLDAKKRSATYHWQIDDDIRGTCYSINAKETNIEIGKALKIVENCVNNFENIGSTGLRHMAFSRTEKHKIGFNKIVYGVQLLKTDNDLEFRKDTIEDVDYTLQLLTNNYCTVVLNRLLFKVPSTGTEVGGNTEIEHTTEKRFLRANTTANFWPEAKWKIKDTNVGAKLGPTRIWQTFLQRPTPKIDNK